MVDDHLGAPATVGPAGARLERLRTSEAWGSLLSVQES
jgi:hypothetical protein